MCYTYVIPRSQNITYDGLSRNRTRGTHFMRMQPSPLGYQPISHNRALHEQMRIIKIALFTLLWVPYILFEYTTNVRDGS